MKAYKYYSAHNMELIDIEKPEPKDGEVLVKIVYCGICGTDIHAYNMDGLYKAELIPGHESVGIVEKIGAGVTCVKVGDRVAVGPPGDCGKCYQCNEGHPNICRNAFPNTLGIGPHTQGAFAEYVLSRFPENELFKIPDGMEFEQAVLFDVIGVGFHAVRRSELKLGDNAVVFGCGSVGLSVIQSAKLAGARNVIAFDSNVMTHERAKVSGADYVFAGADEDFKAAMEILETEGGADVCFECAGHPMAVKCCIELCMPGGQIIAIGSDNRPFELVTAAMGPFEYDLKFSFTYTKEEIRKLFDMVTKGEFRTDMYTILKAPLEDAEKMIIAQTNKEIDVARVLLMPGDCSLA